MSKHTSNMKQLAKVHQHLSSALKVAVGSLGSDVKFSEAKNNIKSAIRSVEKASKKEGKRNASVDPTPQEHWEDVISNVPMEPMSQETGQAVMQNLDKLITQEKNNLTEIQNQNNKKDDDDFDLSDFEVLHG